MKKLFLLVFCCLISQQIFSQESNNADDKKSEPKSIFERKNELRLGAIKMLAGPIFEGTYERVISSNSGYGISLLANFDKSNDYIEDYSLTPFYRMYFQTFEDYGAKGFFVEGFVSLYAGENYEFRFNENSGFNEEFSEDFVDTSIGITLGKKWINSSGFVFEIRAGAGRNLFGADESAALFKGDFSIGYRF